MAKLILQKSPFEVHQVTADGCCGGSQSLNNSSGGLEVRSHWVESPDKQAESGRIKICNTLFTKPPTASLQLLRAQLHCVFTGNVFLFFFYCLFLGVFDKKMVTAS